MYLEGPTDQHNRLYGRSRPVAMHVISHQQACAACVKAKRKCSRQSPACLRCRTRELSCHYPREKPSNWVLLPEEPPETTVLKASSPRLDAPTALNGLELALESDEAGLHAQLSSWFTSLYTWHIVRSEPLELVSYAGFDMDTYIQTIGGWLDRWVQTGSNPFIHAQMYRFKFPRDIQDAYMCLSCYRSRTPANEQMVLRLIAERADTLMRQNGLDADGVPLCASAWGSSKSTPSLIEHIARVQALMIYQFISLSDGNTRLRHAAQARSSLALVWARQMVATAANTVPSGASREILGSSSTRPHDADFMSTLWHSWILSETVRRTWCLNSGLNGIYSVMRTGQPAPCAGGMMFTTRVGVWEATAAEKWQDVCARQPIGLMQLVDTQRLLSEAEPRELNEFAKVVLELGFGKEKVRRWVSNDRSI